MDSKDREPPVVRATPLLAGSATGLGSAVRERTAPAPPAAGSGRNGDGYDRRPLAWVRWALLVLLAVVVVLVIVAAVAIERAAARGRAGEEALIRAVDTAESGGPAGLSSGRIQQATAEVDSAGASFSAMRHDLALARPVLDVGRYVPFVRIQVRGVDVMADSGQDLVLGAQELLGAADRLVHPADPSLALSGSAAEAQLARLHTAVLGGLDTLTSVSRQLASLNGYRLIGPLGTARAQLAAKLPRIESRAVSAEAALRGFMIFAGGSGPRTYLVFTQNPDEVRPTGGYMATYGVLSASGGHFQLQQFGSTAAWYAAHPTAVITTNLPTVLRLAQSKQTLSDTNANPDWPYDAELAAYVWRLGGEPAVNGVMSMTPAFMARIVAVLGPVPMPSYGVTVTAGNLASLVNYYTNVDMAAQTARPFGFLSDLSRQVMAELVAAPASKWQALGAAAVAGFGHEEAMAWSNDPTLGPILAHSGWDYAFPAATATGDFYADSEFEFAAKNGSALQRDFQHHVTIWANGSGTASTTMVLTDTDAGGPANLNPGSGSYIVTYGPKGATLAAGSNKPTYPYEPALLGHPAEGWERAAPPGGTTGLKLVWSVPHLLRHLGGNRWVYDLDWSGPPAHSGDVLHLSVTLPRGWRWAGSSPPATIHLYGDFSGSWMVIAP